MALKTGSLNSVREEMDLPYAGDVLHIVYNPQGYSGAVEKKVNELRDSEQSSTRGDRVAADHADRVGPPE